MKKILINSLIASTVLVAVFILMPNNKAEACDYYGCDNSSYNSYDPYGTYNNYNNYGYSNGGSSYYDPYSYGSSYSGCSYGCGSNYSSYNSSYTQPYQYVNYPQITYVPNQNNNYSSSYNSSYTQPYQYVNYPQIVYVPNQQTISYNQNGSMNGLVNGVTNTGLTTATPASLYYQAGSGQTNYGSTYPYQGGQQGQLGYPYQQNYQNYGQYTGQYYDAQAQYNVNQYGSGQFIRTN